VQALSHQHDVDNVPAAGRTQIRLPLHDFTCDEF
jgi:hypothetical protein